MSELIKGTKDVLTGMNTKGQAVSYSPARDIENSLVGLLKHQINRLQESESYLSALKEAVMARIPEASFMELVDALSRAQASNNSLMEKILSPVIPKAGSSAPLLEANHPQGDDILSSQANKDTLQALSELTKAMKTLQDKPAEPENDLKKSLNIQ